MRTSLVAALAAAFCASGTIAAEPEKDAPKEKKVCQTERVTGSLTRSKRICMTQAEWDQLRRTTRQDLEDIQRNAGAIPRRAGEGSTAGWN